MDTPAGRGPRIEDIGRIALVTTRFMELWGLIPAVVGTVFILASLLSYLFGSARGVGEPLGWLTFGFLLMDPLTRYLRRKYRERFGDAVATKRQKFLATMPFMAVTIGVFIDTAVYHGTTRPGPSLAAMALACYATWVLLRDWRWRPHYVAALAAGLAGAAVTASVSPSAAAPGIDPARTDAFLFVYALAGLGLVITGLFDHYVLVSVLRRDSEGPGLAQEDGTVNVDTI